MTGASGHAAAPPLFTFDTTHHALWAEEVATEKGVPCEVVPAPPEVDAKCDLALRTLPEHMAALANAFRESGIEFRIFGA